MFKITSRLPCLKSSGRSLLVRKFSSSRFLRNNESQSSSSNSPSRIWINLFGVSAAIFIGGSVTYYYGQKSISSNPPSDLFPLESTTPLTSINPPKYCTESELDQAISEILKILPKDRVSNSKPVIEGHSKNGFSTHPPKDHERPKYVIFPTSTEEVSEVMKIIHKFSVPVVPYCGGTSLEGHFYSTRPNGVVLDTSLMNKVLEVHYDDLDCVVQSGVNWLELNEQLSGASLLMGCDCGPNAKIGGMVNTNALGVNATKYGAMISNVISLTVVLPDGTIIKTKQRPRKSSAGYNLTHLFIGSEGTLGIVTEATVKLHVKPRFETVVVGQFPTILDSTNTVAELFQSGIQPNAIELLDQYSMRCINYSGYTSRPWLEVPTIFFKIGGINEKVVNEHVNELQKISKKNNCEAFIFAKDVTEQEELFSARKNIFYSILEYGKNEIHEDVGLWVTDIAVPLSKLSPVLDQVNDLIKQLGLQYIIVGHVGDGNFHADIFYKPGEMEKCEQVVNKMMELGLQNEGTSSGEHGIGNGKRHFLQQELGEDTINLMRKVKMSIDPKRLLNPDKVFKIDPEDDSEY